MDRKTKEQISYNMSQVKSKESSLEKALAEGLNLCGVKSFNRNDKSVFGKPDIVFKARKIAIFCDSEIWHGYDWENQKGEMKYNQDFLISKIEENIRRDHNVTAKLESDGWKVLRFWGNEITRELGSCIEKILNVLHKPLPEVFKAIDLCAGIGGIRRGFELTEKFETVVSAEIDKYACLTYSNLFGNDPYNDLMSEDFKVKVEHTHYDILLAGFPCQTFSRVGLGEGFENEEKGKIFFHIAAILEKSRPCAFFLENVDHLVTRDGGKTFKTILEMLVFKLNYHVIGVSIAEDGMLKYNPKNFIRNSKNFGVPQNRPRTYIIGFDKERFQVEKILLLPQTLPERRIAPLYNDLNDLLDKNVNEKYYMASGYFETLIRHRERQEGKGYGFGYRIVNLPDIEKPIANSLLATGGSGKERNLIFDPKDGIGGKKIPGKQTPLNDKGIRVMTPTEWGKLQGFVNYAFLENNGIENFSFPKKMPETQKYKQLGNSVTIPVIEEMAKFIIDCFEVLK